MKINLKRVRKASVAETNEGAEEYFGRKGRKLKREDSVSFDINKSIKSMSLDRQKLRKSIESSNGTPKLSKKSLMGSDSKSKGSTTNTNRSKDLF